MDEVKYKADLGNVISGRTILIEAHTAQSAYEQASLQINKENCERIIQIRNDRDRVVYCWIDQDGLFPKMRE